MRARPYEPAEGEHRGGWLMAVALVATVIVLSALVGTLEGVP